MDIKIAVKGLVKAQQRLDRRKDAELNRAAGKATVIAARGLVAPMRAQAPVRTGATRKSVKVTRARRGDKPGAIVGPRTWYRHFPIGGTKRGVTPNPWVARAAIANLANTKRAFFAALRAELNR